MSIEAMKLALAALETCRIRSVSEWSVEDITPKNVTAAIEALRTAIQQPEPVVPDSSEHLRVIASLGAALRRLSFAAQTTGGTDGPDAELQSAIRQAEQALSLGGLWQAMSATGEPVKVAPYNPTEEMRWAMKRIDPALSSDQCRALWSAAWSASPSTHPAPSVPTTSEPVDFPAGAIVNGRTLMDRIEAYPFESEGGDLRMCSDWHELRRCFEHLADYVSPRPAPSVPDEKPLPDLMMASYHEAIGWNACRAAMLAAKDKHDS